MPDLNIAQRSLRIARIIHVTFLFAALVYVVVPVKIVPAAS